MKLKSVLGLVFYVSNLDKTNKFYGGLGFTKISFDEKYTLFHLNEFTFDFVLSTKEEKEEFKKEANAQNKGAGLFIIIDVENIDETYEKVLRLGYKPSSEPRNWPWGNREFVLRDPDGYKLVFSQKI